MSNDRLISLAAGVVQEFPPEQVVHAAAQAGFNATGIWCDLHSWTPQRTAAVRTALTETGLCALDLEVLWLQPGEELDSHDRMIDIALDIGARNVLCISTEPDIERTKARLAHLCQRVNGSDLRLVLEFLAFTEVRSLQAALAIVADVAHPAAGILVDSLHLQRTGATPGDLRAIDPALLPYLQLCDARAEASDNSPEGLLEEALYQRSLPGQGELPLRDTLAVVDPLLPLSLEIRSRQLIEQYPHDPLSRARAVKVAMDQFLRNAAVSET
jgi:sugar phosphate isomerase/epimerase